MGILNIGLNNIILVNTNYDEDNSDTIILLKLLDWYPKFEKRRTFKKQYVKN